VKIILSFTVSSLKNYAEDTMKELLGWYGYGSEALGRASDQLRRKRSYQASQLSSEDDSVNIAVEESDEESMNSFSSRTSGKETLRF
jgi:hypothetical protein